MAALDLVRDLLEEQPLRAAYHRDAMRLMHLIGDRDAALAQFERCCRLLKDELDLQPLPETLALAHQIRLSGVRAAKPPLGTTTPELHAPLIGREESWMNIGRASGRLALVEGAPGVGKTRLAEEFARAHGSLLALKGHDASWNDDLN